MILAFLAVALQVAAATPPPAPAAKPWYADRLGAVLIGTGVVGLLAGFTFYELAEHVEAQAEREPTYGVFKDDLDSAERRRTAALGCTIVGGALLAGGVVRYILVGNESPVQATAAVSGDGVWFAVSGALP